MLNYRFYFLAFGSDSSRTLFSRSRAHMLERCTLLLYGLGRKLIYMYNAQLCWHTLMRPVARVFSLGFEVTESHLSTTVRRTNGLSFSPWLFRCCHLSSFPLLTFSLGLYYSTPISPNLRLSLSLFLLLLSGAGKLTRLSVARTWPFPLERPSRLLATNRASLCAECMARDRKRETRGAYRARPINRAPVVLNHYRDLSTFRLCRSSQSTFANDKHCQLDDFPSRAKKIHI